MAKKKKSLLTERMKEQETFEGQGRQRRFEPASETFVIPDPKPERQKRQKPAAPLQKPSSPPADRPSGDPFASKFRARQDSAYSEYKETVMVEPEIIVTDNTGKENTRHFPKHKVRPHKEKRALKHKNVPQGSMEKAASYKKEKLRPFLIKVKRWVTPKRVVAIVSAVLVFSLLLSHIPPLIYGAVADKNQSVKTTGYTITVNADAVQAISSSAAQHPDEDFDGDGLVNGKDSSPYDPDADENGILDGAAADSLFSLSSPTVIQSGNAEFVASGYTGSIVLFQNRYVSSIDAVVAFREDGVPYSYDGFNWEKADFVRDGEYVYVSVAAGESIMFLDEESPVVTSVLVGNHEILYTGESNDGIAKNLSFARYLADGFFMAVFPKENGYPYSLGSWCRTTLYHENLRQNPVVAPAVIASYTLTDERFARNDTSLDSLQKIYDLIDAGHTALCSLQGEQGEALAIVYGYDYLGNLYVADAETQQPCGVISITPRSQLMAAPEGIMQRDWFDFEAFGFVSENGDRIAFLSAD